MTTNRLNMLHKINATALSLVIPRNHPWLENYNYMWAKKEKGARCWITGKRGSLNSHHGFSYKRWFIFRYADFNRYYLTRDVHMAYHRKMGGTRVSTTPFSLWLFKIRYRKYC